MKHKKMKIAKNNQKSAKNGDASLLVYLYTTIKNGKSF
jgi:hypothetical protein